MTTMREVDVRCAVCGTLGRKAVLTSTSSFGPPDLDLRPHGPARWALEFEVQRCDCVRLLRRFDRPGAAGGARGRRVDRVPRGAPALEAAEARPVALLRRARRRVDRRDGDIGLVVPRGRLGLRRQERPRAGADLPGACGRDVRTGARDSARPNGRSPIMHTLIAEVWRRAGRFDEALEECAAAEAELGPLAGRDRRRRRARRNRNCRHVRTQPRDRR